MLEHVTPQFVGLGLAIGLGFLVGLEREWSQRSLLGLRTFTLLGATGGLAALLAEPWGPWIVAAGLLAVAALVTARYLNHPTDDAEDGPGATTVVAALAVYLVGAACVAGYQAYAVVTGGVITLLLHWKEPLHGWVERIGQSEFSAIIRFVLITLVVLPVLPNATFGPYDVINPSRPGCWWCSSSASIWWATWRSACCRPTAEPWWPACSAGWCPARRPP